MGRAQVNPQEPVALLSLPRLAVGAGIALAIFAVLFGTWTATSAWSFARFLLAALLLIVVPGALLVDLAGLRAGPLARLTLSLLLGTIASSGLYWASSFGRLPRLFWLWPLGATAAYGYRTRTAWRRLRGWALPLGAPHLLLAGVLVAGLIPLAVSPLYYRNLALHPPGGMSYLGPDDLLLHLSLGHELTHAIPPQAPFFAGRSLSYHYGMDLAVAMLSRAAGLNVSDLTVRFIPSVFVITTMLAAFCFSRAWLGSPWGAVLTTFLIFFGEDFSFIPGVLLGSSGDWSAQFFSVPTTFSLYSVNPMLPALGLLFGGLFCLGEFCRNGGRAWPILAAALFGALVPCKVFAAAQVLMGLALAALLDLARCRRTRLVTVLALTALAMAPFALSAWAANAAGARVGVRFEHWPYIPAALDQLGLVRTTWGARVHALFTGGPVTLLGPAALMGVVVPGYLLGSLGLRAFAIPRLLHALSAPRAAPPARVFLAAFCILGPIFTLTCAVTPIPPPALSQAYNNSVWFYVQSKYLLWIFLAEALLARWPARRGWARGLVLALVVGLSIPSALQHFSKAMAMPRGVVQPAELELLEFLRRDARPGDVVLSGEQVSRLVVAMTECRVPIIEGDFVLVPAAESRRRAKDRDAFWGAWRAGEVRGDILERYRVAYVVVDGRAEGARRAPPAAREGAPAPAVRLSLRARFGKDAFIVYKVE